MYRNNYLRLFLLGLLLGACSSGPGATDVATPDTIQPDVTEPDVTEPDVTEPDVTEPDVTEPDVTEPDVTEPDVTEPDVTEPDVTVPDVAEPDVAEPDVTEPDVTELDVIDAGTTAVCGDGALDMIANEECDDGNTASQDGCSATCTIEPQCTAGCVNNAECPNGETCVGKPSSVVGATGQCAPLGSPPGTDQPCGSSNPCPAGLACLGGFSWPDGQGFCVPGYQAKDFYSFDNQAIPDDGTTISSSVVACGLATVPVDIVVRLHLDHPRPEDLLVVLEDPYENQGTVLDNEPYSGGDVVTFVGSGDNGVNGLWTLHVTDTVTGESGALLGWSVYLLSQWD